VIEAAIGGKQATEVYEGERRFVGGAPAREFPRQREKIGNILVNAPGGVQVALENLAHIHIVDGPAQISRELAKRRVVVAINVKDRDLGGFVAELQKTVESRWS
jgi:cobalt-zinc-cadmium resistance protein CzcA